MGEVKEFLFVDESGDPGLGGNPYYLLLGMHLDEPTLKQVRSHITTFRYHHEVIQEFKGQGWAEKSSPRMVKFLDPLAELTVGGAITTTANWLLKSSWKGPYLSVPGQTHKFRNFQLRLLLERHLARRPWGQRLDLVIDRWRMNLDQKRNLEDYLRGNFRLRPVFASVTMVDSAYADPIQIVDIYGRLARRVVLGVATQEEQSLCDNLMDLREIHRGIY